MDNQPITLDSLPAFGTDSAVFVEEDISDLLLNGGKPNDASKPEPITKEPVTTPTEPKTTDTIDPTDIILGDETSDDDDTDAVVDTKVKVDPKKTDSDENEYEVLSKEFMEMGVFSEIEGQTLPKTEEEIRERLNLEKQKGAYDYLYNQVLAQHGEEGIKMFESIFVKGVDPVDYLKQYDTINSLIDVDLTDESNQLQIVEEYYTRSGLNATAAKAKAQRSLNNGELVEDATSFHAILVEQEKKDLQQMEQVANAKKQAAIQQKQQYQQNLSSILTEGLKKKEIGNIPVTDKVAKETFDYLYSDKWKLADGSVITDFDKEILELRDPKNHQKKVELALLWKMYQKDPTLGSIKGKGVTEKTDKLFSTFITKDKTAKRTNTVVPSSSFGKDL